MVQQIKEIQISHRAGEKGDSKDTMFTNILDSDLAPSEKTTERLADEAAGVVGAALETTKWAVSVIMVYVLSHATILKELKRELRDANAGDMSITELEKLPYLTAVIEEGLRNSYGAVSRSPRIHRNRPLQYAAYTIPPGTPVSASTYIMHHNEDVFPSSRDFDPSRFLDNARGPDRSKPLSRYVTAFTKGTRMCLGMQLAYAEIELLLAALFTRFEFSLFETTVKDVTITSDQAGVGVWKGSKGIRVTLTKLSA
jgi:cytochrome P450